MKRNGSNRAMMASKAQMPRGWRQVRLGEVAEVDTGGTPNRSRPEYWDGQIPWMASGQINQRRVMTTVERITWEGLKNSNAKLFPSGTVMVAMNGQGATKGKACVLGIEASCNQSLAAICSRQQTENDFLFHVLDSAYHLLRSLTGDGRAGLNLELIRGFSFLLPLLPEQRAIAAVLDSIDDSIERTEAVIEATEQLRDPLLHELLTRGVPGWHSEWKNVPGLGVIPADWEVVRLGEVAEVQTGRAVNRKAAHGHTLEIPYLVEQCGKRKSPFACTKTTYSLSGLIFISCARSFYLSTQLAALGRGISLEPQSKLPTWRP